MQQLLGLMQWFFSLPCSLSQVNNPFWKIGHKKNLHGIFDFQTDLYSTISRESIVVTSKFCLTEAAENESLPLIVQIGKFGSLFWFGEGRDALMEFHNSCSLSRKCLLGLKSQSWVESFQMSLMLISILSLRKSSPLLWDFYGTISTPQVVPER